MESPQDNRLIIAESKIEELQRHILHAEEQISKLSELINMQIEMNNGFTKILEELNKR